MYPAQGAFCLKSRCCLGLVVLFCQALNMLYQMRVGVLTMKCFKKLIACLLTTVMAFSVSVPALADGVLTELDEIAPTVSLAGDLPAKSYLLMEASTGTILAENNADEQMAPASITKIMVMLLLMERIDNGTIKLEDVVTTSEHANSMGGTQIWLEVGETMSVHDLLRATAVNSANDAAVALAEHMAGTEENFVELMNQKAKELGMNNTVFKNATGLDADGHLSTARDIALMSRELLKHPKITEYTSIWMDSLRDGQTGLTNTNKLVRFYEGCNGLKTGTTDDAGSCLSATATRDEMTLVAVTMGSATSKERFSAARSLLDYGFATYGLYTPQIGSDELKPVPVTNGQLDVVHPSSDSLEPLIVNKADIPNITYEVKLPEELEAPVTKGQEIGKVVFTLDGKTIAESPILAAEEVKPLNFPFVFFRLWNLLFS